MHPKPINSAVKAHFQKIYQKAQEKAKEEFDKFKMSIEHLDHFNQSKQIVEEKERLDILINDNLHPYYVHNHSDENSLLSQFASRTTLLNIDESEDLLTAVILGEYDHHILMTRGDLKKSIPLYSYDKFLKGIECPYFFKLKEFYKLSEEDYYKIREWQADNLRHIVTYDHLRVIENIQEYCKKISSPLSFLLAEKEKVESKVDKSPKKGKDLKKNLAQIFFLQGLDLESFNDDILTQSFIDYSNEKLNLSVIHPKSIKEPLKKIKSKSIKIVSNEITIFYTLNKIVDWIETIIEGQPLQLKVVDPDWDLLLTQIRTEADQIIESNQNKIDEFIELHGDAEEEIKEYLRNEFDKYRRKFNALEEKYYFHILDEKKEHILKRMFVTNSFFSNDKKGMSKALKEAIIIQEMSWNVVTTYYQKFETNKMDFPNRKGTSHFEILSLLNKMVLNKEIYEAINNSMNDFMEHFEEYLLPFELHMQNEVEIWHRQFYNAMARLQTVLDDAEPSNKIHYLQSRLKELKQKEIELREYSHSKEFNKKEFKYSTLFKQFLSVESDYIRETNGIPFSPVFSLKEEKILSLPGQQKFDELLTTDKKHFILKMLEDLSITQNGKSILSPRKKGALRGIVQALRDRNILPNLSIESLCNLLADKICLELKSKLDESDTMTAFLQKAEKYIQSYYTH